MKNFYVAESDNVGYDIVLNGPYPTKEMAQSKVKEIYDERMKEIDELDNDTVTMLTNYSYSILHRGDHFYGQIKEVEVQTEHFYEYIKEIVPNRLRYYVSELTDEVCDDIINRLYNDRHVFLDYDNLDQWMQDQYEELTAAEK